MNKEFDPKESFGYKSGIFSLEEGQLEIVVDKIRRAQSSIEAMSILGKFLDSQKPSGEDLGGLLFGIHSHDDNGEGLGIIYYEDDILRLFKALELPEPIWGKHIKIDEYKKEI